MMKFIKLNIFVIEYLSISEISTFIIKMSSDDDFIDSTKAEEQESTRALKRQRNDIDKEKPIKSVAGTKMEKSIFGLEPSDEFIKEVSDWIWKHARNCEHKVEVSS